MQLTTPGCCRAAQRHPSGRSMPQQRRRRTGRRQPLGMQLQRTTLKQRRRNLVTTNLHIPCACRGQPTARVSACPWWVLPRDTRGECKQVKDNLGGTRASTRETKQTRKEARCVQCRPSLVKAAVPPPPGDIAASETDDELVGRFTGRLGVWHLRCRRELCLRLGRTEGERGVRDTRLSNTTKDHTCLEHQSNT